MACSKLTIFVKLSHDNKQRYEVELLPHSTTWDWESLLVACQNSSGCQLQTTLLLNRHIKV